MGKKIPDRWNEYVPIGERVPGTRFLPFKVPLKMTICRNLPEDTWFTPSSLLEKRPMVKAIIDLTATQRYYDPEEFTSRGVLYKKIIIPGQGRIPHYNKIKEFFTTVDDFRSIFGTDRDALIGVHCTHGLNRTGYLICKYMVERLKIDPREAIKMFENARGYKIERQAFLTNISNTPPCPSPSASSISNWRSRPNASRISNDWGSRPNASSISNDWGSRPNASSIRNWRSRPNASSISNDWGSRPNASSISNDWGSRPNASSIRNWRSRPAHSSDRSTSRRNYRENYY